MLTQELIRHVTKLQDKRLKLDLNKKKNQPGSSRLEDASSIALEFISHQKRPSVCLFGTDKKKKNDVGGSGSGLHSDRVANHTETASKKWVSVRVFGPHQRSCKADQTAQPSRSGSPEELEDGQVGVGCQS